MTNLLGRRRRSRWRFGTKTAKNFRGRLISIGNKQNLTTYILILLLYVLWKKMQKKSVKFIFCFQNPTIGNKPYIDPPVDEIDGNDTAEATGSIRSRS